MAYVPFRSELDTTGLIERAWDAGIEVLVPRSHPADRSMTLYRLRAWDELAPGAYGILEPDPAIAEAIHESVVPEAVFVPGAGFDFRVEGSAMAADSTTGSTLGCCRA